MPQSKSGSTSNKSKSSNSRTPVDVPFPTNRPAATSPSSREVPLDFPREWIEFFDPDNPSHLIRADMTWLGSRWTCIFGAGCHGIIKDRADEGCCSHGAYFTDKDDQKRVKGFVKQLTPDQWERHPGRTVTKNDWIEYDELDGEQRAKTKALDDGCVFLNRRGSKQGLGCALHKLGLEQGRHPLETKPDVCWQLPMRRTQEWVTRPDDTKILVSSLEEFDRRGWGEGGHDLHWWCTSSPEAHVANEALYITYAAEIIALIGQNAYDALAKLAKERLDQGLVAPHPASL